MTDKRCVIRVLARGFHVEIYCENKYVKSIWDELLNTGESDIAPIGLGARDTLRFEACLPLYGNEISENIYVINVEKI